MRERLLGRDLLEILALEAAERSPGGGQDQTVDRSGALGGEELMERCVLGVDREDGGTGGLRQRGHELSADHERLLVGQREVDAFGQRGDGREQPGRADDRVEDHVALAFGDQPHHTVGTGEHLSARPRLAGLGRGVGIGQRDPAHPVALGLLQ